MDIKEYIKQRINESINIDLEEIIIEIPKDKTHGDYSSNIALKTARILKDSPMNIAQKIKNDIEKDNNFEKVEIVNPGFINIFVKKEYLFENLCKAINENENYGRAKNKNNIKINVEYVSANPTGLLHVGTCRGAAYGDNICRILDFAGYDVTREYYFNDAGVQIENLGKSLKVRYRNICGFNEELPENGYHGHEIIDIAQSIYNEYGNSLIDEELKFFKEYGTKTLIEIIKQDLKDFRTTFDVWTSEQDIRNSGNIEKCLNILRENDNLYECEGATWLRTTKYGDDKDRVIVKTDGNYTYLVPDIAYHLNKINRGFDEIVDVLGADHHGYVSRLKASVEALGYNKDKIIVKLLQMVRLLRNGEEIKMSKRTGLTITMRELMEEVGIDAARYFFANKSLDTQLDFDMDLAVKKSNENPVYYIQYAHARICSILKDAKEKNIKIADKFETISSEEAYDILKKIYEFENIVKDSAERKLPHLIANYVYELAGLFHTYYAKEKILTNDEKYSSERLALIKGVQITINNALNLIGVSAPDKM
ncbi:MAG: arginine--tRNA ligase [Firmicutes bacterium]|nr:arginine--tRNA ligase [Bacillota bacterium]